MKKCLVIIDSCWVCDHFNSGEIGFHCALSDKVMVSPDETQEWCKLPGVQEDPKDPEKKSSPTRQPKPLSCKSFGGKNGEQENALYSAITTAAHRFGCSGPYAEYDWLENAPRASLVCELRKALEIHGYKIIKE